MKFFIIAGMHSIALSFIAPCYNVLQEARDIQREVKPLRLGAPIPQTPSLKSYHQIMIRGCSTCYLTSISFSHVDARREIRKYPFDTYPVAYPGDKLPKGSAPQVRS